MTSYWDQWQRERQEVAEQNGLANTYAEAVAAVLVAMLRELKKYAPETDGDSLRDKVDAVMEEWGADPIAQMFAGHVLDTMVKED